MMILIHLEGLLTLKLLMLTVTTRGRSPQFAGFLDLFESAAVHFREQWAASHVAHCGLPHLYLLFPVHMRCEDFRNEMEDRSASDSKQNGK